MTTFCRLDEISLQVVGQRGPVLPALACSFVTTEPELAASPQTAHHAAPWKGVTTRRPDPRVWAHALAAVDGDVRTLEVLADGSVLVRNAPRRR